MDFFTNCRDIILHNDIELKFGKITTLCQNWSHNIFSSLIPSDDIISIPNPGRPQQPLLVHPLKVPKRSLSNTVGHAGLIHALAHIEFNAVNLAIDACYRFQHMPYQFYADWLQVAHDEMYHFNLLNNHLHSLGYSYGDFTAHSGLWDMVHQTENDVMIRMALVPRVLEARGIDAVPEMKKKLEQIKDIRGAEILSIIHHDEITHVMFGDKWFKYLCVQRNLNPESTFLNLLDEYNAPRVRGPFNRQDRQQAGFSEYELDQLAKR